MRQLSYYQDEYNVGGNGAEMSLVLFPDAVRHLLRISRILRQPRGNAILIGLAGNPLTPGISIGKSPQGERDINTLSRLSLISSLIYVTSCESGMLRASAFVYYAQLRVEGCVDPMLEPGCVKCALHPR